MSDEERKVGLVPRREWVDYLRLRSTDGLVFGIPGEAENFIGLVQAQAFAAGAADMRERLMHLLTGKEYAEAIRALPLTAVPPVPESGLSQHVGQGENWDKPPAGVPVGETKEAK